MRTGALLGLLLSAPQGGGQEGTARELRATVRESGSRSSCTGADSVALAEIGHGVAASIRRDHEGQGKTNHLAGKETRREFKKQQGIGSK